MRRLAALTALLALGACTPPLEPAGQSFPVFFTPNSAALDNGADSAVTAAANFANHYSDKSVVVAGYSAPPGHHYVEPADMDSQRAKAVEAQLVTDGVDPARISVHPMGAVQPAVPMSKIEVRRVDIIVGSPTAP
jgi:outer membrane protein OmpA-like peptidoglycan-associated protein